MKDIVRHTVPVWIISMAVSFIGCFYCGGSAVMAWWNQGSDVAWHHWHNAFYMLVAFVVAIVLLLASMLYTFPPYGEGRPHRAF